MKFLFKELHIKDFMGIKDFTIQFKDKITNIKGENATGKTTILHALYWIFFGKNSFGKSKFDIFPLDENNQIIPKKYPEVTLNLLVDDEPIKLSKIQKKSCEYYYNEIPVKAKEYDEKIKEFIDEKIFTTLINPVFFGDNYSWQEQKRIILDNFEVTDTVIKKKKFAKIKKDIETFGAEKVLAKYKDKVTKTKKQIDADKATRQYIQSNLEGKELSSNKEELKTQLQTNKDAIKELDAAKQKVVDSENKLAKIINKIDIEESQFNNSVNIKKSNIKNSIQNKKNEKAQLLKQYKELNVKLKSISDTCSYCGLKLDEAKINQQKKQLQSEIKEVINKGSEIADKISVLELSLTNVNDKYKTNEKLLSEKQKIESEIETFKRNFNEVLYDEYRNKINTLEEQLQDYDSLSKFQKDLKAAEQSITINTKEEEENEILKDLVIDYQREYAKLIAEQLNAQLKNVKIRTFELQKNGDIKETFEITMDGVPYKSLNSAGKIIAGVELIQLVNKSLDINFPIVIDNKESITKDFDIPNQLITLEVIKGAALSV